MIFILKFLNISAKKKRYSCEHPFVICMIRKKPSIGGAQPPEIKVSDLTAKP
jgi:hypothetical protein